jgi:DNA-directed RNA polymerase specialized sigma24 family protein
VNADILQTILGLLGSDKEHAAAEYRKLHERLTRFFEWNNAEDPTVLADEALDRLGKRALNKDIEEGIQSASSFVLGIARHLLQEERRRQARKAESRRSWAVLTAHPRSDDKEKIDRAVRLALDQLEPDRRKLVEDYYAHSGAEKAKAHQKLASRLGLSLNTLRNRVFRLRKELEVSIRHHLDRESR